MKQDFTGIHTGHVCLNRHLTIVKLQSDPLCPLCTEDSETSLHLLDYCAARMAFMRDVMGLASLPQLIWGCALDPGFLQVRENWKKSGNLLGQGKSGKTLQFEDSTGKVREN